MPYTSVTLGRIYIMRWAAAPQTMTDYAKILAETAQIHQTEGPVIAIGIIPVDMPSPDGEVRKVMNQRMNDLLANCEIIHYVVEGTGFKSSTLRSVATSLLLITGKRGKIVVHKSFSEALNALVPQLREMNIMPSRVQLAAQAKGLLDPARVKESRPGAFG
jgi:hypothetical protein